MQLARQFIVSRIRAAGGLWLWLVSLLILQGCASVYKPHNTSLRSIDDNRGYRLVNLRGGDLGDHLVFLAFSGGGTRAAALAYGVLMELRDTEIASRGSRIRLLDEVDSISAVSGGSFTAAYFGLFGDRTFDDYEKVFLRQSIQGTLIRKLFNPVYWWHTIFSGLDRTEMAVEYYDSHIFQRKTFADMQRHQGPLIEINATDLGGGNRFAFTQTYFDVICSDLGKFPVARAVTASSAVPVAFPTIVLQNFSGDCDISRSDLLRYIEQGSSSNPRLEELKERIQSYRDRHNHPYIHLVDGGIADNLGLRALAERIEAMGTSLLLRSSRRMPKDILVISVNAAVTPERSIDFSATKPSVIDTIDAFSDVQMSLYNEETKLLLASKLTDLGNTLRERGFQVGIHSAEVAFSAVQDKTLKSYLNNLPTTLELSDQDVDTLIRAGRDLLRNQTGYKQFLSATAGTRHVRATTQ